MTKAPHPDHHQSYAWKHILLAGLGAMITVGLLAELTHESGHLLLIGSFGSSSALLFAFPDSAFSQPRNVLVGHLATALIGLLIWKWFGPQPSAVALATGLAIMGMMALRSAHPPAAANPVIIFFVQPDWAFMLTPIALGATSLILLAWLYNNAVHKRPYPKRWW